MLTESFSAISQRLTDHLRQQNITLTKTANQPGPEEKNPDMTIRMELLCFGHESIKNYLPGSPAGNSIYSFNFFIIATGASYNEKLLLTEHISTYLDQNPFLPFPIGSEQYEMSLSPLIVDLEFINNFWLAQQQPHAPVLFYQARISAA